MTFVEAAIEILRAAGGPLSVEELTDRVVASKLLSKPGKNPLRSMKGRLTSEVNKGNESRLCRMEEGVWALQGLDTATADAGKSAGRGRTSSKAAAPVAKAEAATGPLSKEEQELEVIYADEGKATVAVGQLSEYRDDLTSDEDREMMPEVVAERRGDGRRGRRDRKRRERPGSESRRRRGSAESREPRESVTNKRATGTAEETVADHPAAARSPLKLVEDAISILETMPPESPVSLRQLAQMMRKRRLVSGQQDAILARLRTCLRYDASWNRRHGLLPAVAHHGRDRVSLAAEGNGQGVATSRLRGLLIDMEKTALEALGVRMNALELPALERIAQLYLEQSGYHDIEWVKRAGRSGYATATGPTGPTLVGVRRGGESIDRRGIGELRVGIEAKQMSSGLLLSPAEMGDEATSEWGKSGKSVSVVCGAQFLATIARLGIGVQWLSTSVPYLDVEFLAAVEK